jgi:hypothetical protein
MLPATAKRPVANPRLRICGGFAHCIYAGVCFLRESGWTGAAPNIALSLSSDAS